MVECRVNRRIVIETMKKLVDAAIKLGPSGSRGRSAAFLAAKGISVDQNKHRRFHLIPATENAVTRSIAA
jgi:hypothetical protein